MSLSGALSNALSGLNANAIGTSVISANIANALNENYGRRTTHLGVDTAQSSGGVRVTNVTRFYDPTLVHQKSSASAEQGNSQVFAKASAELERLWGSVDTNGSVARKLTRFETSLMSAASDPSSNVRLGIVSDAAQTFANALNTTSHGIQLLRSNADAAITKTVESLNTGLARLEGLNQKIVLGNHLGQDTLSLQDQRNATLETISNFIPLHTVERDSGEIAVFSSLGRTLLDGRAVEFSFSPTSKIVPGMTLENGQLSRLSIDGKTIDCSATIWMRVARQSG